MTTVQHFMNNHSDGQCDALEGNEYIKQMSSYDQHTIYYYGLPQRSSPSAPDYFNPRHVGWRAQSMFPFPPNERVPARLHQAARVRYCRLLSHRTGLCLAPLSLSKLHRQGGKERTRKNSFWVFLIPISLYTATYLTLFVPSVILVLADPRID